MGDFLKRRRCLSKYLGQGASQEHYQNIRNFKLKQLYTSASYQIFTQKSAWIDRKIYFLDDLKTRSKKLCCSFRLHDQ
jgi:hypothetical protein